MIIFIPPSRSVGAEDLLWMCLSCKKSSEASDPLTSCGARLLSPWTKGLGLGLEEKDLSPIFNLAPLREVTSSHVFAIRNRREINA